MMLRIAYMKAGGSIVEDRKIVGYGNTATVYEWEDGWVLKLFHQGYPKDAVEKEFRNAMAIREFDFPKPKAYEIILADGRMGILYDRVEGISLLDWVLQTRDFPACARYMADLHKQIIQNKADNVPDYKKFLTNLMENLPAGKVGNKEEALFKISRLPDGDTLCHGDYHPGNIFIMEGKATVIDFMNICHGNYLYDVARTVFLVEYTPVPEQVPDKEAVRSFKKTLADLYLSNMEVSREMIQDYLTVIIAARAGEM